MFAHTNSNAFFSSPRQQLQRDFWLVSSAWRDICVRLRHWPPRRRLLRGRLQPAVPQRWYLLRTQRDAHVPVPAPLFRAHVRRQHAAHRYHHAPVFDPLPRDSGTGCVAVP